MNRPHFSSVLASPGVRANLYRGCNEKESTMAQVLCIMSIYETRKRGKRWFVRDHKGNVRRIPFQNCNDLEGEVCNVIGQFSQKTNRKLKIIKFASLHSFGAGTVLVLTEEQA